MNGHALPYEFWLTSVIEDFNVSIKVWYLLTTKDIKRSINHMSLLVSIRSVDNLVQQLKNMLAAKTAELEVSKVALDAAQVTHNDESARLSKISSLKASLECENSENADIVWKLTSLIPST